MTTEQEDKPPVVAEERLRELENDPLFQETVRNVPDADIDALLEIECTLTRTEIANIIVAHTWTNRICNHCFDHSAQIKLSRCSKCHLVYYCGVKCQSDDWNKHKERCCKKNGPLDDGPNALVALSKNT